MDFEKESGGNLGNEHDYKGKTILRHTPEQITILKSFANEYGEHPDKDDLVKISHKTDLDIRQVKSWFQNHRNITKAINERRDNTCALHVENKRLQRENHVMKEHLKNLVCHSCRGSQWTIKELKLENSRLKQERDKILNIISHYKRKSISQTESLIPSHFPVEDPIVDIDLGYGVLDNRTMSKCGVEGITETQMAQTISTSDPASRVSQNSKLSNIKVHGIIDFEKEQMSMTAAMAMDELMSLLQLNEPLWTKSLDGRSIINSEAYKVRFPKAKIFESTASHVESSEDSGIIAMKGIDLVNMFLDSDKWADVFPSIIIDSKTICVIDSGEPENKNGVLQLMYEKMHILSPTVPVREYYFLRHCKQIDQNLWTIVDVSYDWWKDNISHSRSWRFPSGVMIRDMGDGNTKVIWIEHVEVNHQAQHHKVFKDIIYNSSHFAAQRWVLTLQRMCERLAFLQIDNQSSEVCEGVILSQDGRKNVMKLCHRMVKSFCSMLNMPGNLSFPVERNSGIQVNIRTNTKKGEPRGMIVTAATSKWFNVPSQILFNYLKDEKIRVQWDILCKDSDELQIAHIPTGTHLANCISIIQPSIPTESNMVILQESCVDPSVSMIVYAPLEMSCLKLAMNGEDTSNIPILPSGIVISDDYHRSTTTSTANVNEGSQACSVLTVAYQIFVSTLSSLPREDEINNMMNDIHFLITSFVSRIKDNLKCSTI